MKSGHWKNKCLKAKSVSRKRTQRAFKANSILIFFIHFMFTRLEILERPLQNLKFYFEYFEFCILTFNHQRRILTQWNKG